MIIRPLTLTDNLDQVAQLIYQTDPYIYPYWFCGYNNWKQVLIDLIKTKGSIFCYKNLTVAVDNDSIIGIAVVLSNQINFDYDYSNIKEINENFKYTITKYILPLHFEMQKNDIKYISNICVDVNYRRQGVAHQIINYLNIIKI